MLAFIATCPQGLEYPLLRELEALGATDCRETRAGVHFQGPRELGWRACLWSRFASRVLRPLASAAVEDADGLFELATTIPWRDHLRPGTRFAVQAASRHPAIRNTHFAALRVKDAVVDQLGRDVVIDTGNPELRLYAFADAESATIGIDLATRPLHERGYRARSVSAPVRENLAAALLWRAGWPDATGLLDPVCGSGTFLIEAAWMAADIAPGLLNPHFGFQKLVGFEAAGWRRLLDEAEERRRTGLAEAPPPILGFDQDERAVRAARTNASRAGVGDRVQVARASLRSDALPSEWSDPGGLVMANPPYGERLDPGERGLFELYRLLGARGEAANRGGRLAVLTAHDALARQIALPLAERFRVFNGPLPCRLFVFEIPEARRPLSDGAEMVANRIAKNQKRLRRYLEREGVTCYRAYEADIPEYAVAVDVYEDRLHVQEFTPQGKIDPQAAERRLREAVEGVCKAFDADPGAIFLKARTRQRGTGQYERLSSEGVTTWVKERDLSFKVNLTDYLDTGLFLDHRETRRRVRELSADREVLNLFCYTGSVTVHAAAGGAARTVSVDLSKTYLDWAAENLRKNGFQGPSHQFVRADCLEWIKRAEARFDLIFLDPPSFSNSKAMRQAFDVQRDHGALIENCLAHLKPGGQLLFSTNLRKFELDSKLLERHAVTDITDETVPPDFARRRPHRCWEIRPLAEPPKKTLTLRGRRG